MLPLTTPNIHDPSFERITPPMQQPPEPNTTRNTRKPTVEIRSRRDAQPPAPAEKRAVTFRDAQADRHQPNNNKATPESNATSSRTSNPPTTTKPPNKLAQAKSAFRFDENFQRKLYVRQAALAKFH
jgi:hypothetical protein